MQKRYVIIGTSAAALGAISKLRQSDQQAEIICVSDEQEMPYNKCLLADFLSQERQEHTVHTLTHELVAQKNIQLCLGVRVDAINPDIQSIQCSNGQSIAYDSLLIATGSSPIIPPIEGIQGSGAMSFHSLADTHRIIEYITNHAVKKVVVIGAGLSGLECADALRSYGLEITIIERESRVLAHHIDQAGSALIERAIAAHQVHMRTGMQVVKIVRAHEHVEGVLLSSGELIEASLVIYATGLRANDQLARAAGIACGPQGILVDDMMQTSAQSIFAAGDVAMVKDLVTGHLVRSCTWPDAMQQAMVAALAMAGMPKPYRGSFPLLSSSFFGLKFACYGPVAQRNDVYEYHAIQSAQQSILIATQAGLVRGFCLVGDIGLMSLLKRAMLTDAPLSTIEELNIF